MANQSNLFQIHQLGASGPAFGTRLFVSITLYFRVYVFLLVGYAIHDHNTVVCSDFWLAHTSFEAGAVGHLAIRNIFKVDVHTRCTTVVRVTVILTCRKTTKLLVTIETASMIFFLMIRKRDDLLPTRA